MITLTEEQARQIEEAFENAESVAASINTGKHHVIQVDDEKCFWQREEWVRWAIDEVLPEIREALVTIRAARAQEQAEQDLDTCPGCGGVADNGHDREFPPNPYYCTKCSEQAEQEPVAWANPHNLERLAIDMKVRACGCPLYTVPLYAVPVRTKDLTDDEIAQAVGSPLDEVYLADFRAVIAAYKEKNRG